MRIRKKVDRDAVLTSVPREDLDLITMVSDALAHPVRLELFRFIMQKNKAMELVCTGDLVENFDYAQATISQHMNKLTVSGLVDTAKKDKYTYYFANIGILTKYLDVTKKFAIV